MCRISNKHLSADQQAEDFFLMHIDRINFSNISIEDAVHELSKTTRLSFILMSPGYPVAPESCAAHEDPFKNVIPASDKFNFKARDIRLSNALNAICEKADCFWRLTDVAVIIYRKNTRHSFQREIAFSHFCPNERDARVAVLNKKVVPDVRLYNSSPAKALNSLMELAKTSCCFLGELESDGDQALSLITLSGKNIPFLDCIDVICTAADLYWMASGTNEVLCIPSNRLNAGYVHILPNDMNWTNPILREFTRELVHKGESPVARNKTVRIMSHEVLPDVQFRDTEFKDAVTWLCNQKEVPLLFLSKDGASRYPVSFDMTNAPLFTVLDEVCRQSHHYWGFFDGKLAVLSSEDFITNDAWLLPDSFVLAGCPRWPSYKRIFPEEDREPDENPVVLEKLLYLVNKPVIPKVIFAGTPVSHALDWLAKQSQQSYVVQLGRDDTWDQTSPVTISMTNATFLSAIDAICEQADWYWGFRGRIFMLFPARVLKDVRQQKQDDLYRIFLHSVTLPSVSFTNQDCSTIFNTLKTHANAEILKKDKSGFSLVINMLDPIVAEHKKCTFALKSKSVLEAFRIAGEKMDVPVIFKNGHFFIGKLSNDNSERTVPDENADPFK